jgi:asparagine synthase (glutamine-hydrolysing)
VDFVRETASPAVLRAMADALGRRGPDADGLATLGPCGLAHTRLSIIDVAGSPQPMGLPERGLTLVYNGETYNYRALRRDLERKGHVFRTHGDTEVVLRGLAEDWTESLPRLDAMFAVGVWDEPEQRLLLARDAFGEKPLFYATPSPGVLVFASEIKAVLAHPAVDAGLNPDALRQVLRFRAIYSDIGLHQGVRELPPGGVLEFSRAGVELGRHFDLAAEVVRAREALRGTAAQGLIEHGRALFQESVRERLVADVPVGAFLSGGLDSSIIVASMRAACPDQEIRTYSVGFAEDPHSELPHAAVVAQAIGATHQAINVGPEVYAARLAELSACRDAPVSQPADVAIAEMSRFARENVKVVLSGEGADEVFAGYPKHRFANAPSALRALIRALGAERTTQWAARLGLDARRAGVAARALSGDTELDRLVEWFSYLDRSQLGELFPGLGWSQADWEASMQTQQSTLRRVGPGDGLYRMQALDALTWLPGNMLERGDRMTMAEGLELRPPFLDKQLAVFGLALPSALKVRGGNGKWIVRRWAEGQIPDAVLRRPKWGFRTPLAGWFRGPLRSMLHDYLDDKEGLVASFGDRRKIGDLLAAHEAQRIDAGEALWTLLSAAVWYRDVYCVRTRAPSKALQPA